MTRRYSLRVARQRKQLTQEELADVVSVDQAYISLLERGLRTPSDELKESLAKAVGLSPSRLTFPASPGTATVTAERDRAGQSVRPTPRKKTDRRADERRDDERRDAERRERERRDRDRREGRS